MKSLMDYKSAEDSEEESKVASKLADNESSDKYTLNLSSVHSKRRTFEQIRILILHTLVDKRKTINQIAKDIDVNWRTVEAHLDYLAGQLLIKEVFASEYVRIFEISPKGRQVLSDLTWLTKS